MQILEIVLYGHNGAKRTVKFKPGAVNIISGLSATGKSSLLEIADYCLGKSTCDIAEGPVRSAVAWYGLLLQFDNDRMFIARQSPPIGSDYSSGMYVESGSKTKSPIDAPEYTNSNFNAVVKSIGSKIGISPYLHTPEKGRTRENLAATLRHSMVYCFQKQTEIANKRILFHGQEDGFISNSISDTLEYFLGAIKENSLAVKQQLILAKREVKRKERELQESEELRGEGVSRAIGIIARAKELGILSVETDLKKPDDYVDALKKVIKWTPKNIPKVESSFKDSSQAMLMKLQRELRDVDENIDTTKRFADEVIGYTDELKHQKSRLETIGIYEDVIKNKCPLCSNNIEKQIPKIEELQKSLEEIKENLEKTPKIKPRLREQIYDLQEKRQELIRQIDEKHEELSKLIEQEEGLEKLRNQNITIGEVIGSAKFWLESVELTDDMSPLRKALAKAEKKVEELDSQINRETIDERMERILTKLSNRMTEWALHLKLEHSGFPVIFDPKNITVAVKKPEQIIPLIRMGSAQNWLGYHMIVNLALHEYFTNNHRPVPRFLFLDQPTQVYYPADVVVDPTGSIENLPDPDRIAVERLFNFVFEVQSKLSPNFQVIITDHVMMQNNKKFMNALRENWRDEEALVPLDWLS